MKFRKTSLAISVSLALVACGGGGGPGSNPLIRGNDNTISITRIGTIKPLSGVSTTYHETGFTARDLDGANGEELIIAGRANMAEGTTPANWKDFELSIWGWQGGTLVDQSSQWFGAGVNRAVVGVEDQVMFGDFDGDGHTDMYAGPYTDIMSVQAGLNGANTGAVFFNSGASSFNQRVDVTLGNLAAAHASAVADINGDGIDDVWSTAGATSVVVLGDAGRNLTHLEVAGMPQAGGAGIAVADFTAVGVKTVIFTDQGSAPALNNLYSYNINLGHNRIDLTHIRALPAARFTLPKWAGYGFGGGSHEIRVLADIQLTTGRTASGQGVVSDAVIFSRPNQYLNGQWPAYQEAQFLLNDGTGNFTDITDTVLKGWVSQGQASYNQVFKDVNNDGRLDIIVPGNSWDNNHGSQILIWQAAGNAHGFEYQSFYNVLLTAAQDNAQAAEQAIHATAGPGANGVALLQDPQGAFFIATAIDYESGGARRKAIYMTPLNSLTPAATVAALKANWPWLSDQAVQNILAQATTTYFGMNLLDPGQALNPQGILAMPTASGLRQITGSVSGLGVNGAIQSLMVQDAWSRSYKMDYSATRLDSINTWANRLDQTDDATRGLAITNGLSYGQSLGMRFGASADNTNQVFGMPHIRLGGNWSAAWQFTNLNYSPWMNITGSWGSIKGTSTSETVLTWAHQGWRVRGGAMYTTTKIEPGLVTKVNPITAAWGDVGYSHDGWSISAGTLPRIVRGSAELSLPTGVDTQGRILYTNITAGFDSPLVGFARLGYQGQISKTTTLSAVGMKSTQDSHMLKIEVKSKW